MNAGRKRNPTHTTVCDCSPLTALRGSPCGHLDFTLLLLPSPPFPPVCFCTCLCDRLVFASAPFHFHSGVCMLSVLCEFLFFYSFACKKTPQKTQKTSTEIAIGVTPHARTAGDQEPAYKTISHVILPKCRFCPPDLCIQVS